MKKIIIVVSVLLFLVAVAGLSAAPAEELEAKGKEIAAKLKAAEDDVGSQQFRNALEAFHKCDAGALAGIRDLYFCDKGLMDALPVRAQACTLLNKMHAYVKSEQTKIAAQGTTDAQPKDKAAPRPQKPATCPTDIAALMKACEGNDPQACYCAAVALWDSSEKDFYLNNGPEDEVSEIFPEASFKTVEEGLQAVQGAQKLYQKACTLGHAQSCFNAARIIGSYLFANDGYMEEGSDEAKENEKDVAERDSLIVRACELGHAGGCYTAGTSRMRDWDKAKPFFLKACGLGDQEACNVLASH